MIEDMRLAQEKAVQVGQGQQGLMLLGPSCCMLDYWVLLGGGGQVAKDRSYRRASQAAGGSTGAAVGLCGTCTPYAVVFCGCRVRMPSDPSRLIRAGLL